jgi:hypothetical protein
LALGIPALVVFSHALAVFAAASFTHGNISLPEWLERLLRPVVITLDLHLIHHSIEFYRENWNYGAVLSAPFSEARSRFSASCHRSNRSVPANPINRAIKGLSAAAVVRSQVEPVQRLFIARFPLFR